MSQATPIVFIVDDDVSVRESLEALILTLGWNVESFSTGEAFLLRPRSRAPSCLVLDVTLPDLDGLEVQKRISSDREDMPIVFITGYGDVPKTVRAMKAGAVEFLTKPFCQDALLDAIRSAIARSRIALDHQAHTWALLERYHSLSRREREVMSLVVSGSLNKQVGGELGISEITVKAHRGQVMRKMQASSVIDLANMHSKLQLTNDLQDR